MNIDLKTIENDKQYEALLAWIDGQFDLNLQPESPAGMALQATLLLVKDYEELHYPIPTAGTPLN